jgi:hypothetical protein
MFGLIYIPSCIDLVVDLRAHIMSFHWQLHFRGKQGFLDIIKAVLLLLHSISSMNRAKQKRCTCEVFGCINERYNDPTRVDLPGRLLPHSTVQKHE